MTLRGVLCIVRHVARKTTPPLSCYLTRFLYLHRGVGRRAAGGLGDRADVRTEVEEAEAVALPEHVQYEAARHRHPLAEEHEVVQVAHGRLDVGSAWSGDGRRERSQRLCTQGAAAPPPRLSPRRPGGEGSALSLSAREGSPEHAGGPLEQKVAAWVAARHVCDRAAVQKRNCTADHTRWKARVLS